MQGTNLYKTALKLEYLDPQFKNKWVLCAGAFHTVLCALRCLDRTIEGRGLDEALQGADMYSSVTVTQVINGNHNNRAVEAHQITLQVFLEDHPELRDSLQLSIKDASRTNQNICTAHHTFLLKLESLNLEKQLRDYDKCHTNDPMYKCYPMCKWTRMNT